ncbi:uncharacterized protein LOC109834590 [Asparagus officinalis]|uniref:uncharacterized protein LOC109834590 n=1 Tax=Asparagus officinalis TaxID=4686 RepID=UPI00098E44C3|nr:uncharacterized protein LOC109834590 [Asparagus officinalis]
MESSNCMGFMAVFAVSSSIAIVTFQAHKRLLSDFMRKAQLELVEGTGPKMRPKSGPKKKVRFAPDVVEPSSNNDPLLWLLVNLIVEGTGPKMRPKSGPKKKVRFAPDVVEPSSNNEEYRRRRSKAQS